LDWDERERRRLEDVELRLGHILHLLEAPDVRMLLEDSRKRRELFLDLSSSLRRDVLELIRLRALSFGSLFFVGVFFVSYYLMRLKAMVSCGKNDLRFLSGLELMIFRGARF
jgi:hypothetical protein